MNVRPITWPTVPKGKDRVRICLHAGNTKEEVDGLIDEIMKWAVEIGGKQFDLSQQRGMGRKSKEIIFSKL